MKELKGDFDEVVNAMLDEIATGKRIDFALVNHVPIKEPNINLEYYLAYAVDWFMVRHNKNRKEATNILLLNLRYVVGYYDRETTHLWHEKMETFIDE